MGTPEFAVPILKGLIASTDVVLVVSQPDKPVGRKKILTASPVKTTALQNGIEVFTPERIREDYEPILKYEPDMIVTCAYGQIIPAGLLTAPKYGCINVHASLLPKYRGGAPIHRAIMNGDAETGITIMYMDEGMDSGDIIKTAKIAIDETDTLDTLSPKLSELGDRLLQETLPSIIEGTNPRTKQNPDEVTFAPIITKTDELINFDRPSKEVYDHIRALSQTPGAYFTLDGKKIKVYSSQIGTAQSNTPSKIENIYKDGIGIGTRDKEIIITTIKPEGKNIVSVKDYLNGIDKNKLKGMVVNVRVD